MASTTFGKTTRARGRAVTHILRGQTSVTNEPRASHARFNRPRNDDLTADGVAPHFALTDHSNVDAGDAIATHQSYGRVTGSRLSTHPEVPSTFIISRSSTRPKFLERDLLFGSRYMNSDRGKTQPSSRWLRARSWRMVLNHHL